MAIESIRILTPSETRAALAGVACVSTEAGDCYAATWTENVTARIEDTARANKPEALRVASALGALSLLSIGYGALRRRTAR